MHIDKAISFKIVKPRHMRESYGSRFVSECVCYRASSYIPSLYVQNEAANNFL